MRKIIGLLLVSITICNCSQYDKKEDCEPMESYNQYLWLDGSNETLIDNALRCFELNSIGYPNDSCIRVWDYEVHSPDSVTGIYYLNMFEFGVKRNMQYATSYNLEWKRGKERERIVTCVKKKPLQPKSSWSALKERMNERKLNRIDTIPIPLLTDDLAMGEGLVMLQYINENSTRTVDYSAHYKLMNSRYERIRRFTELVTLIKDEFSVNLYSDHWGHDLFKYSPY